jgi:sigma-B regulation protein RsbU (phosphoserine phosphatase)
MVHGSILVITDDAQLGASLRDSLGRASWGAILMSGARAAAEPLPEGTAGILADVRAGEKALERAGASAARIIACGRRGDPGDILAALRAGARDYLPLDFTPEELEPALEAAACAAGACAASLEYRDAGGSPRRAPLIAKSFSLGRDPSNNIAFDDAAVSRFHARIVPTAGGHAVIDEQSRHGVFINGARVADERDLSDGDEIRLGAEGAPVLTYVGPPGAGPSEPQAAGTPSQEMRDIASLLDTFLSLRGDVLLDDLLEIVVARSMDLAGAERGLILLAGDGSEPGPVPPGGGLRLATARRRDGTPIDAADLAISRKIPEEVMASGQGVILQDLLAHDSAEAHPATIRIGVRSAMCVPLRVPRRSAATAAAPPLGVLYVDSSEITEPFTPRRLSALESLAAEAAQAIHNARLYQVSLEKRQIDEELRIARTIQRNFLPPSGYRTPWIDLHGTSEATREVGGDLLNYHAFGEDRLGLVVGDVSGKGLPAAIFSSVLDGLCYGFLAHPECLPDLGRVATELNRFLVARLRLEKFVSLLLGVIVSDGTLGYVNAGHNPPFWIRKGGALEELRAGGPILGVLEDAAFEAGSATLSPGDVLVLYSDGITEARGRERELFGVDRLQAVVLENIAGSAREIHDAVLTDLSRFTRGEPLEDDATLMVIRYLGPADR